MNKSFKTFLLVLVASLCVAIFFTGCNNNGANDGLTINGEYYEEQSDGSLKDNSWIKFFGKNWIDSKGMSGTYEISDNKISFFRDGEELFAGILGEDELSVEISGTVYRKEPTQNDNNNGSGNNGNGDNGNGNNGDGNNGSGNNGNGDNPPPVTEIANVVSVEGGEITNLTISMEVSWTTKQVDLSGKVVVSEGASWKLSHDENGNSLISTKRAEDLQDGGNTYYIIVSSSNNVTKKTYTLGIYRPYFVTITYVNQGVIYATEQVLTHTKLDSGEVLSRDGYTFNGWGCNEHFVTEPKTFDASWTANKYDVTFDANGGNLANNKQTLIYGRSYALVVPTLTGYSFLGWWYMDVNDEEAQMTNDKGQSKKAWDISSDVGLYAKWRINSYTITIRKNIQTAGNISGNLTGEYESDVTLTATTNTGYTWLGWYDFVNKELIESNSSFDFSMPAENKTYEARWSVNRYTVTTTKNVGGGGNVTGGGDKEYNSSVTLAATINTGYTWQGWYEGEEKVSEELTYTFTMPAEIKTFEARWKANSYTVTTIKNIEDAGTTSGSGEKEYNSSVTLSVTTNKGYTWLGWYEGDKKVSINDALTYTFKMYAQDMTYEAKWMICPITLSKNIPEAGEVSGVDVTALGGQTTIVATVNDGYAWQGWYEGREKVSEELTYTFIMSQKSKTYEARWSLNTYTLSTIKNIENAGKVIGAGEEEYGSSVTIEAISYPGYSWLGWYDGEEKVSQGEELTYTFAMPEFDKTYEARWLPYQRINSSGIQAEDGGYILFGEYPQTIKKGNVSITVNQDDRGYYLGNDGHYYAKVIATPNGDNYLFSNNSKITSEEEYYFKVEPIRWRILEENGEELLILCESIIAGKRYDESSNNYMNSEVKAWLDNEFYNTAFIDLQKALIQTTEVNNDADSTGLEPNIYACDNTFDNIFLLSYKDIVRVKYGFSSNPEDDAARVRITSDYARATGIYINISSQNYGSSTWWLRSPANSLPDYVRVVYSGGNIELSNKVIQTRGIVPAMTIKLS